MLTVKFIILTSAAKVTHLLQGEITRSWKAACQCSALRNIQVLISSYCIQKVVRCLMWGPGFRQAARIFNRGYKAQFCTNLHLFFDLKWNSANAMMIFLLAPRFSVLCEYCVSSSLATFHRNWGFSALNVCNFG